MSSEAMEDRESPKGWGVWKGTATWNCREAGRGRENQPPDPVLLTTVSLPWASHGLC